MFGEVVPSSAGRVDERRICTLYGFRLHRPNIQLRTAMAYHRVLLSAYGTVQKMRNQARRRRFCSFSNRLIFFRIVS